MLSPRSLLPALAFAALLAGCPAAEKKCSASLTMCLGNCVDAQTDATGCGAGCVRCPIGGSCIAGVCECPAGLTACSGVCVDTQTSAAHCGGCSQGCGLGTCDAGTCLCDGGTTNCPDPLWPRCVNTAADATNCGTCRNVCPLTDDVCIGGGCTCPPTLPAACPTAVPTACVNLQTDKSNCGSCDAVCPTGATCTATGCDCPGSTVQCGSAPGTCTDTSSDVNNCGSCGHVCETGATCAPGGCLCPTGRLQICGSAPGTCCAGSGCCGDTCKTAHSNGLGQSYFDCNAVGTRSLASATAAATAWSATGNDYPTYWCGGNCFARQDLSQIPNRCATWCYDGSFAGKVSLNGDNAVCTCPPGGTFVGDW